MQIQIESPHVEPNEELLNLINSKIAHLGKMYDRTTHCNVVLRKEKDNGQKSAFIEVRMEVPKGTLFASEKDETFESALEKVIQDLEHQLRRHKEEMEERR